MAKTSRKTKRAAATPERKPSPMLTDFDLYLFGEGTHLRAYEKLGSHLAEVDGQKGVYFAVWAPNARRASIVGDFNGWDGNAMPLYMQGNSGIWAAFVPGLEEWTLYKYRLETGAGVLEKADPYAFAAEMRPKTASLVFDCDRHAWGDEEWMQTRREHQDLNRPISIYEMHLGSWRKPHDPTWGSRYMTYNELAEHLVPYVAGMGYTHIELMPVCEYPLDASWGYQTLGYFAPTSRYGTPDEFQHFVDTCHRAGIGVILDWVPGHFPKDAVGLGLFDGTHLYEHADPRQGSHPDWGTYIFNYGRKEVQTFLLSNAMFWLDKYHVDGLRIDAVASMLYLDYSRNEGEWIPNRFGGRENLEAVDFLKRLNYTLHGEFPGILTVAEESTAWPMVSRPTYLGGLGFSMKWNMGWMHDMLVYITKEPIHRRYHQGTITFSLLYAFTENFVLPLSHDEVVHGKGSMINKMPGDLWQQFANLRAFYGFMYGHPGKKLLFMGGEFGQRGEWDHGTELEWGLLEYEPHRGLQDFVRDLNRLVRSEPSLHEVDFEYWGFEWIDFHDADNSVISFLRRSRGDEFIVVVCNFTPVPRHGYRVGVPEGGYYREILNSDSHLYGGSDMGNYGGLYADDVPMQGRPYSLNLNLPPLSTLFLKKERE